MRAGRDDRAANTLHPPHPPTVVVVVVLVVVVVVVGARLMLIFNWRLLHAVRGRTGRFLCVRPDD